MDQWHERLWSKQTSHSSFNLLLLLFFAQSPTYIYKQTILLHTISNCQSSIVRKVPLCFLQRFIHSKWKKLDLVIAHHISLLLYLVIIFLFRESPCVFSLFPTIDFQKFFFSFAFAPGTMAQFLSIPWNRKTKHLCPSGTITTT